MSIESNKTIINERDLFLFEKKKASGAQCIGYGIAGVVALIAGRYFGFPIMVGGGIVLFTIAGYHLVQMISAARQIRDCESRQLNFSQQFSDSGRLYPKLPPYLSPSAPLELPPPSYDEVIGGEKKEKPFVVFRIASKVKKWFRSFFLASPNVKM